MNNLAVTINSEHAAVIATRFLERDGCDCENPGPDCPTLAGGHVEYLTGEDSLVYEFPLTNKGKQSGYVLISGSRTLPPVLEFCPVGNSLRDQLSECFAGLTKHRRLPAHSVVWRYFGPLDLVAELELDDGGYYYARLPNLRILQSRDRIHTPSPKHSGSYDWLATRWRYYESEKATKGNLSCSKMFGLKPIRYNQTCASSILPAESSTNNGPNYCTPSCIAGCVATAWTVLAGTWKGAVNHGSEKIFSDAPDWAKDWASSYGGAPPPASQGVNRRMWAVHKYLQTSCSGNTSDGYTIAGRRIFSDYGVNWNWGSRYGTDYAFASSINKAAQPGLITAQSVWIPNEPPEGHGIVTHGWNDNDQHLWICLGWGSSFPDKWIAFSTLSSPNAFFVTHFDLENANEITNDELPMPAVPSFK